MTRGFFFSSLGNIAPIEIVDVTYAVVTAALIYSQLKPVTCGC